MNEKILKYLYDVKLAIDEIDTFFIDNEKRYEEYQKNILLKRAIERNLEIIGEAIKRILCHNLRLIMKNGCLYKFQIIAVSKSFYIIGFPVLATCCVFSIH